MESNERKFRFRVPRFGRKRTDKKEKKRPVNPPHELLTSLLWPARGNASLPPPDPAFDRKDPETQESPEAQEEEENPVEIYQQHWRDPPLGSTDSLRVSANSGSVSSRRRSSDSASSIFVLVPVRIRVRRKRRESVGSLPLHTPTAEERCALYSAREQTRESVGSLPLRTPTAEERHNLWSTANQTLQRERVSFEIPKTSEGHSLGHSVSELEESDCPISIRQPDSHSFDTAPPASYTSSQFLPETDHPVLSESRAEDRRSRRAAGKLDTGHDPLEAATPSRLTQAPRFPRNISRGDRQYLRQSDKRIVTYQRSTQAPSHLNTPRTIAGLSENQVGKLPVRNHRPTEVYSTPIAQAPHGQPNLRQSDKRTIKDQHPAQVPSRLDKSTAIAGLSENQVGKLPVRNHRPTEVYSTPISQAPHGQPNLRQSDKRTIKDQRPAQVPSRRDKSTAIAGLSENQVGKLPVRNHRPTEVYSTPISRAPQGQPNLDESDELPLIFQHPTQVLSRPDTPTGIVELSENQLGKLPVRNHRPTEVYSVPISSNLQAQQNLGQVIEQSTVESVATEYPSRHIVRLPEPPVVMSPRSSQYLDPAAAAGIAVNKQKAIQEAENQERAIHEKLKRNGHSIPKYKFLELIGKGAYGRVFKANDEENNRVVALKVIDVDLTDYKVNARAKDDTIEVTVHEIKVLKQLKDSNAKNVNVIFDAFQIHSQLWIVNDYCPGGSVHTLMRATGNKLDERYIIPIARELAAGLKAIHDAGIIHRDVKSANVMIHENGSLQIIDFGVAGVLQTKVDKRTTVIGTPHWMPPELHKNAPPEGLNYGTEVDVWAYGCTLIECATGQPPNARIEPGRRLGATIGRNPPRLNDEKYSDKLRSLVAFVLEGKAADRPSMEAVLGQPFIAETETTHPTSILSELVKTYYRWERSGGLRQSLFFQGGAAAAEFPEASGNEDEWNFSTTAGFEQLLAIEDYNPSTAAVERDLHIAAESSLENYLLPAVSYTPEAANNEERVKRGEEALKGMFNQEKAPYKYEVKDDFVGQVATKDKPAPVARSRSDLPLRSVTEQSSFHHKEVELSTGVLQSEHYELPNIDLANVGTIKANRLNRVQKDSDDEVRGESSAQVYGQEDKRATKDWKFPTFEGSATPEDALKKADEENAKRATKDWKFPTFESQDTDTDATASTSNPQSSKRATMDWTFPTFAEATTPTAPVLATPVSATRPRLLHSATAPVGDLHQADAMLDLDELYDSEPSSTAPVSEDEESSRPASDDEDLTQSTSDQGSVNTVTAPAPAAANTYDDADDFNEFDPFWFHQSPFSRHDGIDEINAYLTSEGVTDVMERAALRREFMQARLAHMDGLIHHLDEVNYRSFEEKELTKGLGRQALLVRDHENVWGSGDYEPEVNAAPETNVWAAAAAANLRGVGGSSGRAFPEPAPPSAESLREDATPAVVEQEMRRLLGEFVEGMGVLAEAFGEEEGEVQGENGSGGEGVPGEAEE